MKRASIAWWWLRWFARYFPGQLMRRLWFCRYGHRGPMYDGEMCLTCGAPWFSDSL